MRKRQCLINFLRQQKGFIWITGRSSVDRLHCLKYYHYKNVNYFGRVTIQCFWIYLKSKSLGISYQKFEIFKLNYQVSVDTKLNESNISRGDNPANHKIKQKKYLAQQKIIRDSMMRVNICHTF